MTKVNQVQGDGYKYGPKENKTKEMTETEASLFIEDCQNYRNDLRNDREAQKAQQEAEIYEAIEATNIEELAKTYETGFENDIKTYQTKLDSTESNVYDFGNSTELSELESQKTELQGKISEKENEYKSVLNGTHEEIAAAQKDVNDAQTQYNNAIKESEKISQELKDKIEENTLAILGQQEAINYIDGQIQDTNSQIAQQDSKISALQTEIASYDAQISKLEQLLESADEEEAAEIRAQIRVLEQKRQIAITRKGQEEQIKTAYQNKLTQLQSQKSTEETKLQNLKSIGVELEKQAEQADDDSKIQLAYNKFQQAKQSCDALKESLKTRVEGELEQYGAQMSELDSQINALKSELYEQEQQKLQEENNNTAESEIYPETSAAYSNNAQGVGGGGAYGNSTSARAAEEISAETLKKNLDSAKSDLDKNKKSLDDIYDGKNVDLSPKKELQQASFQTLMTGLQEVNPTLAGEVSTLKSNLDAKEALLDAKDREIANYEAEISELKNALLDLDAMSSSLGEVEKSLDSVDESGLDSAKRQELSSKKDGLSEKISEIESQKESIKQQIEEKENSDEYEQLKQERTQLKEDYDTAFETLENKLAEVTSQYPNLEDVAKAYKNSYSDYTAKKEELINIAKGNIATSQTNVDELTKTYSLAKAKETAREYRFASNDGEVIADFAAGFIGCNEADGSANKFLGSGSSSATPWCAAFVNYVLKNSGEYDDVASWYKNIGNKWYCPDIANAAQSAGAIIDQSEAQPGDIVLFYSDSKGRYSHVGIVESVDSNGTVHTIEGNTSNQVARRTYQKGQRKMTFCSTYA